MAFDPFAPRSKKTSTSPAADFDLGTVDGLQQFAQSKGITLEEKEKKLSILQRLGRGLSSLEPINAFYESNYEGKDFATEYISDIFSELGSALTGKEKRKEGPKKTFKDILVLNGMKDKEGQLDLVDVAGLAGDILTDPSTFFGGAIAKGIGKGAKVTGGVTGKVIARVSPRTAAAGEKVFDSLKDATGKLFVYGYGTSKGLAEAVLEYTNKVSQLKSDVGETYAKLFKDAPKEVQADLVEGLIGVRRMFGSKREALLKEGVDFETATKTLVKELDAISPTNLFKDIRTVKFFTEALLPQLQKQKKVFTDLHNFSEDMLMSTYFPFIKKKTVKEFNNGIRVGNEGYMKKMEGIMKQDEMIVSAPEAYATRAFQVEKDYLTRQELFGWIKQYGKTLNEFTNADEALKAGYKVVKEKGMFGKEVGYLPLEDAKFIHEIYDPSYKALENLAQATGFDAFTSLFKKGVTGLFPAFHARNYVSGMIQNYEVLGWQALRPKNVIPGKELALKLLRNKMEGTISIGGKTQKVSDILKPFKDRFSYTSSYLKDFGWDEMEKMSKSRSAFNPITWPRGLGNAIETQQKMIAYVTSLNKGKSVEEALSLAERAGFNYAKMTPFEKNIMRRLIPFYSYSRANFSLQLKTLAETPQRIGNLTKAGRSAGTPQSTEGEMPDWMRNRFMMNAGKSAYGLPQVISGFGTPIEEQAEMYDKGIMGLLSKLNPILRVPFERATGKDFFTQRDLKDVYTATEYAEAPQFIKNWLKIKEVEKPIYKEGKKTGEMRTAQVADPERLQLARALFTSRSVSFLHTLFGESELSQKGKILKSITGLKPYEIDEEAIKYFDDRDNIREFTDFLKSIGLLKKFEKAYIPKEE